MEWEVDEDMDDDFQAPLPMPPARTLTPSSRDKVKGKSKVQEVSTPTAVTLPTSSRNKRKGEALLEEASKPSRRPKLQRIAKTKIGKDDYRSFSGDKTASTSTNVSIVNNSNETSHASLEADSDYDFQEPLPMPVKPLYSSSRPKDKGKGKAKSYEAPLPSTRTKLQKDASFIRGLVEKMDITEDSYPSSSGSNTASTSYSNSMASSGNATTSKSLDVAEYEFDYSVMDDLAIPPPTLTDVASASQQVYGNEIATQSNTLASQEDSSLATETKKYVWPTITFQLQ